MLQENEKTAVTMHEKYLALIIMCGIYTEDVTYRIKSSSNNFSTQIDKMVNVTKVVHDKLINRRYRCHY